MPIKINKNKSDKITLALNGHFRGEYEWGWRRLKLWNKEEKKKKKRKSSNYF